MTEPEYVDDEEILSEDEMELESIDFRTYLKYEAISFGRQLYCASSVLLFPILYSLHTYLLRSAPKWITLYDRKGNIDEARSKNANALILSGHVTMVSAIGQIISLISLNFLGRKYTVAVANLLYLVALLHSYRTKGLLDSYTFEFVTAHTFVREFSFTPYFIYLAEITSPTWRAFFMGLFLFEQSAVNVDLMKAWADEKMNRVFRDYAILTSVSLLLALYLPETPFYETLYGNPEKAEETFTWLRAGVPDMLEFDEMTEQAETIEDIGLFEHLRSRTFLLCLIFSFCIVMCSLWNSCHIMSTFLHDLYVPRHVTVDAIMNTTSTNATKDTPTIASATNDTRKIANATIKTGAIAFIGPIASATKNASTNATIVVDPITESTIHELVAIIGASQKNWPYSQATVRFLFLIYSLVVPRKIIFLVSYVLSFLVITIVALHPGSLNFLITVARFCDLTINLGLTNLALILPTEIYPAALRDIGVAIVAIWSRINLYLLNLLAIRGREDFPASSINRWMSYGNYFGSIFGFIFILTFLPETWKMNIYQLDELDLRVRLPFLQRLPFSQRKEKPVGRDSGTESEIESPDEDEAPGTEGDGEKDAEELEEIGTPTPGPVT